MFNELIQLKKDKKIMMAKHPDLPLYICNYSKDIQFKKEWTDILKMCRGLIIDNKSNIISRCMPKFFNHFEHINNPELGKIPNIDFDIYEKLDGSMISVYYYNNQWNVASRGSFVSEHAVFAKKLLFENYKDYIKNFDKNNTYVFELIAPQFRIVVDYGDMKKLFLLAIIENKDYKEYSIDNFDWPDKPKKYHGIKDINKLLTLYDNNEGFVLKYKNNFRLKVKFEEYFKLHKLVTGFNILTIWEMLKNKEDFNKILETLPDEFYNWFIAEKKCLEDSFDKINNVVNNEWKCCPQCESRKELALWIKQQTYPQFMFPLIDNKDNSVMIWKSLRPKLNTNGQRRNNS